MIMTFLVWNVPAQPPCSTDIDRNFSVLNAIQALNRAAAAQNITDAKNELKNAALNLEQVMNYGALQWKECISYDPNLSIDLNPDSAFVLTIANNPLGRMINSFRNK